MENEQYPPPAPEAAVPPVRCQNCGKDGPGPHDKFCAHCGFPQNGTDDERVAFHRIAARAVADIHERDKRVRNARNILFVVAGLNMIPYLITGNGTVILIGSIISAAFAGLAIWAKYRPFPAILTAFILFVALNIFSMIKDPTTIYSGIVLKVIVFTALLYALRALRRVEAANPDR